MDWEGAELPPSPKSTKVIEKPVDILTLVNQSQINSSSHPVGILKENLSFHQSPCYVFFIHPVLKFLCPSLVKLWGISREREDGEGEHQMKREWKIHVGRKA